MQRVSTTERLSRLRDRMQACNVQAYFVISEDEHFNEHVDPSDLRCAFISGFTGSACTTVVTLDKAALWTDGRYYLQASQQLDDNWIIMKKGMPGVLDEPSWLARVLPPGGRVGFDPIQLPFTEWKIFSRQLADAQATSTLTAGDKTDRAAAYQQFTPVYGPNLVDLVWQDMSHSGIEACQRPSRVANPLFSVPITFAGISWSDKLQHVRKIMQQRGAGILVLPAVDDIAWLLNLRGSDILHNPVFFAYMVITLDELHIFVHSSALQQTPWLSDYFELDKQEIFLHDYDDFFTWLDSATDKLPARAPRAWLDVISSFAVVSKFPDEVRIIAPSPVAELKTVKHPAELKGIRQAHIVDSLVLCDFLAWLMAVAQANRGLLVDGLHSNGEADEDDASFSVPLTTTVCDSPPGQPTLPPPCRLTEYSAAVYLENLRSQAEGFVSPSFHTISCADSNGAVVHYRPTAGNDAPLTKSTFYLVDSGGQYLTGTTDVTRTVHLGSPTPEQCFDYTLVLKAYIALATQMFPSGTPGSQLDVICRRVMWQYNRDYAHGTGHGVGAFLSVHEGPVGLSGSRINKLAKMGVLEPGVTKDMVLTIEPGFYETGKYGIRLENVVFVVEAPPLTKDPPMKDETQWLTFNAVTLVPFQLRLIVRELLKPDEVKWLNAYHAEVREVMLKRIRHEAQLPDVVVDLASRLSASRQRTLQWILQETEPIALSDT